MSLVVKQHVLFDPAQLGFFLAATILLHPLGFLHPIQKLGFGRRRHGMHD
jgi:hypothetical protein